MRSPATSWGGSAPLGRSSMSTLEVKRLEVRRERQHDHAAFRSTVEEDQQVGDAPRGRGRRGPHTTLST